MVLTSQELFWKYLRFSFIEPSTKTQIDYHEVDITLITSIMSPGCVGAENELIDVSVNSTVCSYTRIITNTKPQPTEIRN